MSNSRGTALLEPVGVADGRRGTEVQMAPTWQSQAACRGVDVSLFFPVGEDPVLVAAARAVCGVCPVATHCLEAGLHEPEGIWGGRTSEERRNIRHRRSAQAVLS